ncbi:MAG: dTDP-4-dehydrorhamnose 3,5-epimerase [Acidobacteria bacterium]|nr:dTDP-4-dehydrorhamnose 3,5-epimerase [Acidobacteriota bacterium]
MEIRELKLKGTYELTPKIFEDERGYFSETFKTAIFEERKLATKWIQENQSFTRDKCTIRGLHFQAPPFAQTKLVRAITGRILDVFVDVRKSSPTYGRWDSIELSGEKCNAVYISRGFAHGFCTLESDTLVQYKVDSVYSRDHEGGLIWNDPALAIDWNCDSPLLSEKDKELPLFADLNSPFA